MKVQQVILEKQQLNEAVPIIAGAIALAKVVAGTIVVGLAVDVAVSQVAQLILSYQRKGGKVDGKSLIHGMKITDQKGRQFVWDGKKGQWWFFDESRGTGPYFNLPGTTDKPDVMAKHLKYAAGEADVNGKIIRSSTIDLSGVRNKVAIANAVGNADLDNKSRKFLNKFKASEGGDINQQLEKIASQRATKALGILGVAFNIFIAVGLIYNIRKTVETLRLQEGKIVNGKVYTKQQLNEDLSEIRGYTITLIITALTTMTVYGFAAFLLQVVFPKNKALNKASKLVKLLGTLTKAGIGLQSVAVIFSKQYREWWANAIADIILVENVAQGVDGLAETFIESFGYDYHKDVLSKGGMADKDQQKSADVGSGKNTVKPEDLPANNPNKNKTIDDLFNLDNY